jgi:hypothetical protein
MIGLQALAALPSLLSCSSSSALTANSELEGKWATACLVDDSGNSVKFTLEVAGSGFSRIESHYVADSGCGALDYSHKHTGSFRAARGSLESLSGAKKIDFTLDAASATPLTDEGATALSTASHCGISAWISGAAQSVLGKTCRDVPTPLAGGRIHDIYLLVSGELFLGELTTEKNGVSDLDRPATLASYSYSKVR